ncbi:MAG TPA: hypothetical protein DD473_26460 [Planctomycetaceae bacterium]|nr:hypothetical protein [Planctomycetaceae bacterium]
MLSHFPVYYGNNELRMDADSFYLRSSAFICGSFFWKIRWGQLLWGLRFATTPATQPLCVWGSRNCLNCKSGGCFDYNDRSQ